jgi:hypothetical protein
MAQRLDHLHQAGHPRCGIEVTNVGLGRGDATETVVVGLGSVRLGECGELDRVTDRRAGAVGIDEADAARLDARHGERFAHHIGVTVDAGGEEPDLSTPVIVDGGALDDGEDRVAITDRVSSATQHDSACAAGKHRAGGGRVEGSAMTVGREDLAFVELIAHPVGDLDGHSPGDCHVAFEGQEALRGKVHRNERGRARRLHIDAGASEVESVGHARGEEVLVVARVAQQEPADLLQQLPVREQVVEHVGVGAATAEDPNGPGELLGHIAGRFDGLPHALDEVSVLGVHDRRVARTNTEEGGVEEIDTFHDSRPTHVLGRTERLLVDAGGAEV